MITESRNVQLLSLRPTEKTILETCMFHAYFFIIIRFPCMDIHACNMHGLYNLIHACRVSLTRLGVRRILLTRKKKTLAGILLTNKLILPIVKLGRGLDRQHHIQEIGYSLALLLQQAICRQCVMLFVVGQWFVYSVSEVKQG